MIMWPISVYNCDLNNFFRSIRYNADDDVDAHQLGWDDEEQLGVLHHERGHAGQDRVASLNIIVRQLCLWESFRYNIEKGHAGSRSEHDCTTTVTVRSLLGTT